MWAERWFREGGKYLDRREVRKVWVDLSRVSVRIRGCWGWSAVMERWENWS